MSVDRPALLEQERARLDSKKRRAYQLALVLMVVTIMVNWVTREPGEVVQTYVYASVGVLFILAVPVVRRERVPLRLIEVTLYTSGVLATFVGLVDLLYRDGPLHTRLLGLTGAQFWAVALALILCLVMFDRPASLWIGGGVLATSALLTGGAIAAEAVRGDLDQQTVVALIRVHAFLITLFVLVIVLAQLREQLHRALERAELLGTQAMTDPLTGIANRYAAEQRLAAEHADALRHNRALSVAICDVDHFKRINDEHGHDTGDAVLRAIASLLADNVRVNDVAARWGGEEFVLLLPDSSIDAATEIAERCRQAIHDAHPSGLPVTATFGVAEHDGAEQAGELLRRADVALYDGKRQGRDRVIVSMGHRRDGTVPAPTTSPPLQ